MKALFSSQDILDLVENGFPKPTDVETYNALSQVERDLFRDNRKDSKSLFYIFQAVHESIFPRIATATKPKQAWDILQRTYQGMAKVKTTKLQILRRDFETICMKESENIDSFSHMLNGSKKSSLEHAFKTQVSEEDQMLEEEVEVHTKVEEASIQAQVEEVEIKIQVRFQAKIKHKARGMINLKFNVIIVRSMTIMKMNVGRNSMILVTN
eukprot:PITA_22288